MFCKISMLCLYDYRLEEKKSIHLRVFVVNVRFVFPADQEKSRCIAVAHTPARPAQGTSGHCCIRALLAGCRSVTHVVSAADMGETDLMTTLNVGNLYTCKLYTHPARPVFICLKE